MWQVQYYSRKGGHQPVAEWLKDLDKKHRAVIHSKIRKLEEHDLELLGTEMLKAIQGSDRDFYELRGGDCRIAVYCDRSSNTFVLLHGWVKKKRRQEHDIELARRFLHDYTSTKGG